MIEQQVLRAVVWGDTKGLDYAVYSLFRDAGVLHILVLSGQNILLLTSLILTFLPSRNRILTVAATALVAIFYLVSFSNEPSIVRASIMALVGGFFLGVKRYQPKLFILVVATCIVLILHPSWITSASFLLSCGATLGIICAEPYVRKHTYIQETLIYSIGATIGTLPVMILVFRSFNFASVFVSLAILWLVSPIMLLGILGSIIAPFLFPAYGLIKILLWIVAIGAEVGKYTTIKW